MSDLVERLAAILETDHDRLCQGREYECTCGWDERTLATAKEASAEITRLQKEIETAREALEPFVQYAPEQCFVGGGRFTTIQTIEAGGGWFGAEDFRRARKVYLALKDKEVAG